MGKQKVNSENEPQYIFERKNYIWMLIGLAFIAVGFLLMIGGGSEDPQVFNPDIYSWRRIRLAPTLILIGLAIEVYAILMQPKKPTDSSLTEKETDKKLNLMSREKPKLLKNKKK